MSDNTFLPIASGAILLATLFVWFFVFRVDRDEHSRRATAAICLTLGVVLPEVASSLIVSINGQLSTGIGELFILLALVEAMLMDRQSTGISKKIGLFYLALLLYWLTTIFSMYIIGSQDTSSFGLIPISIVSLPVVIWISYHSRLDLAVVRKSVVPLLTLICSGTIAFAPFGIFHESWTLVLPGSQTDFSTSQVQTFTNADSYYITPLNAILGIATRWSAWAPHPNQLGFFAATCVALGLAVGAKRGAWLILAASLLIITSGSRTALAAAVLATLLSSINSRNKGKIWLKALIGFSATILLYLSISSQGASALTLTGRTNVWSLALEGWQKSPILGQGYDIGTLQLSAGVSHGNAQHAENLLVNTLWTSGLVGISALVFLIYCTIDLCLKVPPGRPIAAVLFVTSISEIILAPTSYSSGFWALLLFAWCTEGSDSAIRSGSGPNIQESESHMI